MQWEVTWTALDQEHPNLVAETSIDRGRQFELDRTDAARATVRLNDKDGILDPTNTSGPYFGKIGPRLQASICRWDPIEAEWQSRFRGWTSNFRYVSHPSQRIQYLEIELIDIFALLSSIEMLPDDAQWGDAPPAGLEGQIWFDDGPMDARITQVLSNALGATNEEYWVVFTGNVTVRETAYSPGESPMTVIQEAADAEFPGVSNVYTDRFGRLAVHGRLAKFDPATIAAGAGTAAWDWHNWHAGDSVAVAAAPSITAHLRRFEFSRGLDTIRNSALATPLGILDADVAGQIVQDATSITQHGYCSWSAQNLITQTGLLDSSTALQETRKFAEYIVANYADPRDRISTVTFQSMRPGNLGHVINWRLLSQVDIADQIDIDIDLPGGGGFADEECFVEGIHEESRPLNGDYDMHTVTLDLSPKALFTDTSMFPFPS